LSSIEFEVGPRGPTSRINLEKMPINRKNDTLGSTSRTNLEDQPLGSTSRIIYKRESETPLEAIERFRDKNPYFKSLPMTYAGRLDPMAHGALICLIGEECKEKDKYNKLDKIYEFEILLGFHTDTYDILGLVDKTDFAYISPDVLERISDTMSDFVGSREQEYPPFSSKTINGKSMFDLVKRGELNPHNIPSHKIKIYSMEKVGSSRIVGRELEANILKRIGKVKGDFRQNSISRLWTRNLEDNLDRVFEILKFRAKVSSGTYVRSLVHELSVKLNIPMCTFSIFRSDIVLI
jgi:tRNA pseudouridine(55) synthase